MVPEIREQGAGNRTLHSESTKEHEINTKTHSRTTQKQRTDKEKHRDSQLSFSVLFFVSLWL